MRILHLGKYCPPFFGGIENVMMDLAQQCIEESAEVAAICHHHQKGLKFDTTVVRGVTLYRVPTYGQLMFAPVAPLFGHYLNKVIDEFKPDVLHIHMPNTSAFFALMSAKAKKLKWVIHWHSDVLGDDSPWFLKLFYPAYGVFESLIMKRADKVIATSPPYLEISPVLQRFKDKTQVIPLGLKALPSVDKVPSKAALQLLMVGRLTFYKGHQYVIEALSILKQQGLHDIQLNIVGTGEHQQRIAQQIERLDLSEQVKMLGNVDYLDLLVQLKSADLLLLPSLERTEAFGVVLMEAACYGVPAIVSNVPGSGMSFVVENQHSGLVVERKSPQALAQGIIELYNDRDKLEQMALNAKQRFEQNFAIDKIAKRTMDLYRQTNN